MIPFLLLQSFQETTRHEYQRVIEKVTYQILYTGFRTIQMVKRKMSGEVCPHYSGVWLVLPHPPCVSHLSRGHDSSLERSPCRGALALAAVA
jgi:hypothetical protein